MSSNASSNASSSVSSGKTTRTTKAAQFVRDRVIDAAERNSSLRIAGRGTWLDAGRAAQSNDVLSLREHAGITEYIPGDLTLTALAGTTLAELRDATAEHGQWLALDPFGSNEGTIGATVATGSSGPLQTHFGRARDLVLGIEYVTGTGSIARGGGRVVKNVAGFDMTRLLTGSWGTLGVITEVSVRLHARPPADETFAIALNEAMDAARICEMVRGLPFLPYACELLNDELSEVLLGDRAPSMLVRIGGNREAVVAQRAAVANLGEVRDTDPGVWESLRGVEPAGAYVFRLSRPPAQMERVWTESTAMLAQAGALVHANLVRGVVRCIVPPSDTGERAIDTLFRSASDTVRVGERLSPALWTLCPAPEDSAGLVREIKRTFDPRRVLNRERE